MQCVTVSYGQVRGAARGYRYWQPALYESSPDGLKWRYVQHLGTARRSERLAERDSRLLAERRQCCFVAGVRHHHKIEQGV